MEIESSHTLYIDDISLAYANGVPIIHNASAVIPAGSLTYILGASGSGKSTLMQSIIGLLPPIQGSLCIGNQNIYASDSHSLYSIIGVVFQNGGLLEDNTVYENIALILQQNTSYSNEQIHNAIIQSLHDVQLHDVLTKYPAQLSGGMKKRVALARALVLEKSILLCDEPTSGLDPLVAHHIDSLLFQIHNTKKYMTLCIISHDIRSALKYADNIILLYDKTIYFVGSPHDLKVHHDPYIRNFILAGTQ